ncbi:MAG TPA: alanine racemase [Stellaceae bacterium]
MSGAADRAGAVLEIDLGAVAANWRMLRDRAAAASGAGCAAVVKADAYGLGIAEVGPALAAAGCRTFFVAHIDEGMMLRGLLPHAEIAVLNGLLPGTARVFREYRLLPVLNDLGQVDAWRDSGAGAAILQVESGMNRLGLPRREVEALAAASPDRLGGIVLRAVMSHLACADEPEHPMNAAQRDAFAAACRILPPAPASLAASSGIFLGPDYHGDLVRPGAALYGVNPLPGRINEMRQVVRLKGKILQVRDVDTGDAVGYGATHRKTRPGRIATVAVGYADGWLRSFSNRGSVVFDGHKLPLVGRVSMDLITIDVSSPEATARVRPGDCVELLGDAHTVDDAAAEAGTIGYEILTSLGRRYHRSYVGRIGAETGAGHAA